MYQQACNTADSAQQSLQQTGRDLLADFNPTYCFYDNNGTKVNAEYVPLDDIISQGIDNSLNDIQSYLKEIDDDLPLSPFNPSDSRATVDLSSLESDTNWFTELPLPVSNVSPILSDNEPSTWQPRQEIGAASLSQFSAPSPSSVSTFSSDISSPSTPYSSDVQSPNFSAQYPPTTPSPSFIPYSPIAASPQFIPYSPAVVSPTSTLTYSPSSTVASNSSSLFDLSDYQEDSSAFKDFDFSSIECQPQTVDDLATSASSCGSPSNVSDVYVECQQSELLAAPIRTASSFCDEGENKSLEKRLRKKQQNKDAAIRYRRKKKAENDELYTELMEKERKNYELVETHNNLQKQLQNLRELMDEVAKKTHKKK